MSEQPFEEKDVLWRWKPTEEQKEASRYDLGDEIVFTPYDDDASLVRRWWRSGGVWNKQLCGGPTVELLRQLREGQERCDKYRRTMEDIRGHCAEQDHVSNSHLLRCIDFDARDALAPVVEQAVIDVTPAILDAVSMLVTDWNGRRAETGMDPDALSPEMQKVEGLLADLRAGRVVCRRNA